MCAGTAPVADNILWGNVTYLLGWMRGDPIPPLVTTSPAGTPQGLAGVIGPGTTTRILFGNKPANTELRSGLRLELGGWLDQERTCGLEVGALALNNANSSFQGVSTGSTILARPFIDTTTGQPASALVGFPGVSSGTLHVSDIAHRFYGLNVDLRENICCTESFRLDALVGYRAWSYTEHLLVQQTITPLSGPFVSGTTITSNDGFGTRNVFNGIDAGLSGEWSYNNLFVNLTGKVAGGTFTRGVTISGSQVVQVPGSAPAINQGGLLALSSNIGAHPNWTYTLIPEMAVSLGYQVSSNIRVSLGYWVMFWPNVVRPGDQVDTFIDTTLIPPPTSTPTISSHPANITHYSTLWVQALTCSLEFRY
jgi:hypothetical protein